MSIQWIPLDALDPHPENVNRMSLAEIQRVRDSIWRTGLYEPLVVRRLQPAPATCLPGCTPPPKYQIINGHRRAEVLRELGHTHARCDVWEVTDEEASRLVRTLNHVTNPADAERAAREKVEQETRLRDCRIYALERAIAGEGLRECDIPACNCGGLHPDKDGTETLIEIWRGRANKTEAENARLCQDMETAWGIIASAYAGDWSKAESVWRRAAERWRDGAWNRIAAESYQKRTAAETAKGATP